ncbi:MAG: lipopolysaccharide heptosyltransferase family protein [Gammaproteobacteria bacterium]|nr:lipopolysaccharide heptosyltransferase family protein [Gammaproteobacteria bacterium]
MSDRTNHGLLVRLPNWVGDVIMALPAIKYLQDAGISLTLLGKPWIHDLLHGLNIPKLTYPASQYKATQFLKACPEKNILLLTNSFSSALNAKLAGKTSFGYSQDGRRVLLHHAFRKPSLTHETDIFHHLTTKFLSISDPHYESKISTLLIPQLPLRQKAIETAQSLLNRNNIDFPFIVLCPFAHGLNRQKQPKKWPHWVTFAKKIKKYRPIICPGPQEIEEAKKYFPDALILPNLNLETYAAILKLASKIIANDSGPLHIAAAVHQQYAPIGLFGVTPPERTGPKNARILGSANRWPEMNEVLDFL